MKCLTCQEESHKVKYSVLYNVNMCDMCIRFEEDKNLNEFTKKEWKEEFSRRGMV